MVHLADQTVRDPYERLEQRIRDLERQLRELRAARRLESASIGRGGITVRDGGAIRVDDEQGQPLIGLGRVRFADDSTKPGLVVFRASSEGGTVAMSLYDGIWAVWDRQSNMVMSTDEVSGQGIARPWLPVTWAPSDYTQWPGTTSSAFSAVLETLLARQQPRIYLRLRHTTDASGTTGELRVMCAGQQLGGVVPVGFSIGTTDIGPVALPTGPFGGILGLSVDARRTAGTGAVRATVSASWTQQS